MTIYRENEVLKHLKLFIVQPLLFDGIFHSSNERLAAVKIPVKFLSPLSAASF